MSRKLIAGNWKMNGGLAANEALVQAMLAGIGQPAADVALCAPAPYLAQLQSLLQGSPIAWGAQDVSAHEQGAYTGEVSVSMLKDFGCRYAIVGHSERRQYHGETDAVVAAKALRALEAGVTPVVCVGEPLAARQAGMHEAFVLEQLEALRSVLVGRATVVVAYEPVWAIGTGLTADNAQIEAMHRQIHLKLLEIVGESSNIAVLYGGSVKADNAQGIMAISGVDGVLVGGASLDASQFKKVCYGAAK